MKQKRTQVPKVRFKIRGGSPEGRKTVDERIYKRDEF